MEKKFYGWIIVLSSFVILFLTSGVMQTFSVYFSPILKEFGWDRAQVSFALSISMLFSAAFTPVVGKLISSYGPRKIILLNIPIMALSIVLLGMVSSLWQYYLFSGLSGLSYTGLGFVTGTVLVARWFKKNKATAMSIFLSAYPLSQIILIPFSTFLIEIFGWRTSYIIYGGLTFVIALPITLFLVKDEPSKLRFNEKENHQLVSINANIATVEKEVGIVDALKTRSFSLLLIAYIFCGITDIPITAHFIPFALDKGFSLITASSVLSIVGIFMLIGTISVGPISDKFGRKNIIAAIYSIRAFSLLLILGSPNIIQLYAFSIPFGFAYFGMVPVIGAWIADSYGQLSLGKLSGIVSLIHSIGSSIGTPLLGYIFDEYKNYNYGLLMFIILSCIASLCFIFMKEKETIKKI